MERPYEFSVVDALVANSLRVGLGMESIEPGDPPFLAEALAVQALKGRLRSDDNGDDSVPLIAGFRLGLFLCCRVLADPLRTHGRGVRSDVRRIHEWLSCQ